MKIEQTLEIVDRLLNQKLSDLQWLILEHSGQSKTYLEIADECGYSPDYIREHGAKLWQLLSQALKTKITKKNWRRIVEQDQFSTKQSHADINCNQDWETALDVSLFCGRSQEIATLQQWIIRDRCRLVSILGIGGIGKTSLAIKLGQQVAADFDYLIWRSLKNAPSLKQILEDIIQFVSNFENIKLNSNLAIEAKISRLITYLQSHRCLVILDNVESILQNGSCCGKYRLGYENYGKLFQSWGEIDHQSCLILTSREKPQELISLSGTKLPVRCWQLSGLNLTASKEIVELKGNFLGSILDWQALTDNYRGNPLALKIVATTIGELFDGSINSFLQQKILLFDDLESLLAEQFKRLSSLEKDIMYWLAIEREAVPISQLQQDFLLPFPQRKLLEAIKSLLRRSLIERVPQGFTLQPVVMEYAIIQILKQVTAEIETTQPQLLVSHALIKAQSQDHLRQSQNRTILGPLASQLLSETERSEVEIQLQQIVDNLRGKEVAETGYAVGNIINLLHQLEIKLNNYDFSQTYIRQAFLQNVKLHNVKLNAAHLQDSVFSQSLALVFAIAFNPQGTILATGSFTGEIYLWQMPQGRQVLGFPAHQNWVQSLAFSGDGRIIVSGSYDGTVKLWNTDTGACLRVLETIAAPVSAVVFSPDAQMLVCSSHDGSIKLWDTKTWNCLYTYSIAESIFHLAFSCDLQYLICGCGDGSIRIVSLATGDCHQTLEEHQDIVDYVIVSRDSRQLLSGSFDNTIKRWDLNRGKCLQTLRGHKSKVSYLAFNPEQKILASASYDHTIRLWNHTSGKCLKVLRDMKMQFGRSHLVLMVKHWSVGA